MRPKLEALLAVAAASAIVACGGDSAPQPAPPVAEDQRAVIETVDALQEASRDRDGARICREIFTRDLAESVAAAARTTCAREVGRNLFTRETTLAIGRDIRVNGDRAVTTVTEQDGQISTLSLAKQAGRWRIEGVRPGPRSES